MQLVKPVDWISETKFVVDGLEFRSDLESYTEQTTPESVVILKESRLLREYLEFLAPHRVDNLFELGVWQGGSPLFYGLATDARKIVALDHLHKGPRPPEADHDDVLARAYKNPALDQIIAARGMADRVKLYFSTSQDDRAALTEIMDREFGSEAIDLVIDDASHYYQHSRTSFEIVFPRLREGGLYIIEDWQWAHTQHYQSGGTTFEGRPALSNLIFELLIAYGSHPDLFWNMVVRDWFVAVQKGSKPLESDFRLDDLLRMRGKRLTLI
jgi:cephalosporin hydroxylase